MKQLVETLFATAVFISFAGPASGQTWDVQLVCPSGDWVIGTNVTLTCSVRRANYNDKTCASRHSETAYFLLSPHDETSPDCRVTSFLSPGSPPPINVSCWCSVANADMYTCQYQFVADSTQEGSWRCAVDCLDASSRYSLIEDTVDCSNKNVTGPSIVSTTAIQFTTNTAGVPAATTVPSLSTSPPGPSTVIIAASTSTTKTSAVPATTTVPSLSTSQRGPSTVIIAASTSTTKTSAVPATTTVPSLSTSQRASCTAGQFINAGDSGRCTPCPVGRYQGLDSETSCKKCPDGFTTNSTGSRNIEACQAPPHMKNTLSVRLRYVLLVICTHEDEVKTSIAVHAKVVEMQSDWSGACSDPECSNAHVTSTCEGPTSRKITSVIAIEEIPPTLTSTDNNITLPTNEAFLQAILFSGNFDLQKTIGALLQKDEVSTTVTSSCRPGYVRSGDSCVAEERSGISPELIGSIIGGVVGLIAVVLLVVLVVRQFRTPRTPRGPNLPDTEHPYDSLTSSAGQRPKAYWNPVSHRHSSYRLDSEAPKHAGSERASGVYSPRDSASVYDYLELQDAMKGDYSTLVGTPAALTPGLYSSLTSQPDQEMTSKPELPSRTGVMHMSDRPGREVLGSSDTTLEVVTSAQRDPKPTTQRASGVHIPQEAASVYDYPKRQDATKDDYLTPVCMPTGLTPGLASSTSKPDQEMTSKPEQEMTSKPELPSRSGEMHLSDRPRREGLGSSDTTLEVVTTAPRDPTPTAHKLAAETDYITPIFEETMA